MIIICPKHGPHGGPHCCNHLQEAVYEAKRLMDYFTVMIDIFDDSELLLHHFICLECLINYSLENNQVISGEIWEKEENIIPYTCPVCKECFKEFEQLPRV